MGKLPIVCGGERIGEAETERDRLYIRVNVRVALRRGLWCAWGIGGRGETRIGILEPVDGESVISRRFSRRSLADAGEFSRVELRPAEARTASGVQAARTHTAQRVTATGAAADVTATGAAADVTATSAAADVIATGAAERVNAGHTAENPEAWTRTGTARLFRSVRFQRQLRNVREALTRTDGERRRIALTRDEDAPFPIPELFCLATPARIAARDYWVFAFDRQEWPVL